MKVTVKKEQPKNRILNRWAIFAIVLFALVIGIAYFISYSVKSAQNSSQLSTLNFECAQYGNQLTSELSSNSTVCKSASNFTSSSGTPNVCGADFYCYYRYYPSCSSNASIQANTLSCLCDALKPTQVVISGELFCIIPSS